MTLARDVLHTPWDEDKKKPKRKWLVQGPNSYFVDVKCPGSCKINMVYSHAQTVFLSRLFSSVMPANSRKGQTHRRCLFRRKQH